MGTEPILCYSGITTPMATTTPMLTAKVTPLPTTPEANLRNTTDVANVSGRSVIVGGREWTGGRGVYNVVWWGSKHFCHYHVHHSHLVFFLFHIKFPLFLNTSKTLSPDIEFFETRSLSATYFQEPPFRPEIDAHFGGNRSSAWQFIFRG